MIKSLVWSTAGLAALMLIAPTGLAAQTAEPNQTSTAAEVVAQATGRSNGSGAMNMDDNNYGGPSAGGGTRSADAAAMARRSQLPRMFDPGTHHYRPHFLINNPISGTRPSTFSQRFVTWRLGYVSDGFRGSYFK